MSEENVEAFERATEAYNRRDVGALLKELDPEVEWHSAILVPLEGEATIRRGHDGVREVVRELDEAFAEVHIEYSEIRDLGDRIVALGHVRTRGKESGVVSESPFGNVTDLKSGRGIRIWTYLDPKDALEAAGLRE